MIELIKHGTNYDFMGKAKYIAGFSGILTLLALIGIFTHMNYGVDFRGGAEVQVKFKESVALEKLRDVLSASGLKGVSVQTVGAEAEHEILIKVQAAEGELNLINQSIAETLKTKLADSHGEVQKVDIVGPKAGMALRFSAAKAMFWAILAIMIYVAIRFDFRYAPGAMISLFHDVVVVSGFIAWTGHEFSLQTVAALLAIIGYSINDTVIVYDRIREHELKDKSKTLKQHINEAVNDTLSRTLITSGATALVTVTMFLFGGSAIRDFFFAMSLGIFFGTYSSVYVAAVSTWFFDTMMKSKVAEPTTKNALV